MFRRPRAFVAASVLIVLAAVAWPVLASPSEDETAADEVSYLGNLRALTTDGRNGEAYFSPDGEQLIFQSVRGDHPHYQIYTMPVAGGAPTMISTGEGKTTCAFWHPDGKKVIWASTHLAKSDGTDERTGGGSKPEKRDEPKHGEGERRGDGGEKHGAGEKRGDGEKRGGEGGGQRRGKSYRWDFDAGMDIFRSNADGSDLERLTDAPGYDAEGSYSPNGDKICFTSNRTGDLEIWVMDADGGNAKRLTYAKGYDGGPFFSPDGEWITFRGFRKGAENHRDAQLYVIRANGTDETQISDEPGTLNWGPFWHPSGKWIVYSSNRDDPKRRNFELYLVRPDGTGRIRLTNDPGFDALPTFSADGTKLTWTSSRGGGAPQNWVADFTDPDVVSRREASADRRTVAQRTMEHVRVLASDAFAGRKPGEAGGKAAARYIGAQMFSLGLRGPDGKKTAGAGDYRAPFEFAIGVEAGAENHLRIQVADGVSPGTLKAFSDFTPLTFSSNADVTAPLVFAGYGIVSKENDYDDYAGLDVKGKAVAIFRNEPQAKNPHSGFAGDRLTLHADLRYKASVARDKGAVALIVINDPLNIPDDEDALVPLKGRPSLGGTGIPVIQVKRSAVAKLFAGMGKPLEKVQAGLDHTLKGAPFAMPGVRVRVAADLVVKKGATDNVIGILPGSDLVLRRETIVVGAHYDHLGHGGAGSLAEKPGEIHNGADDNASGTSAMIEVARALTALAREGRGPRRTVVFIGFGAEEMGLLGSAHYVKHPQRPLADTIAMLNMDMVGRLNGRALTVGGAGTATEWPDVIEKARTGIDGELKTVLKEDGYGPSDHSSFYSKDVPVLFLFTGAHTDYHKPSDDADKVDAEGLGTITLFAEQLVRQIDALDARPTHLAAKDPAAAHGSGEGVPRSGKGAYLGTIPDYAQDESIEGVLLSGVRPGSPSEKAGLKGGDRLVELADKKIGNLYDFTYALRTLKPGDEVKAVVMRDGKKLTLDVTVGSR